MYFTKKSSRVLWEEASTVRSAKIPFRGFAWQRVMKGKRFRREPLDRRVTDGETSGQADSSLMAAQLEKLMIRLEEEAKVSEQAEAARVLEDFEARNDWRNRARAPIAITAPVVPAPQAPPSPPRAEPSSMGLPFYLRRRQALGIPITGLPELAPRSLPSVAPPESPLIKRVVHTEMYARESGGGSGSSRVVRTVSPFPATWGPKVPVPEMRPHYNPFEAEVRSVEGPLPKPKGGRDKHGRRIVDVDQYSRG